MRLSLTRQTEALAPKLPDWCPAWVQSRLALRRGMLSMLAAAPGVGKSITAANIAIRSGARTVYFSADTGRFDVTKRTIGILTGDPMQTIEDRLDDEMQGRSWAEYYEANVLHQAAHIDWVFDSDLSLARINQRLLAHSEVHGDYPELVIVDNLTNTISDMNNEVPEIRANMQAFLKLARTTNAHVMVLHHLVGAFEDGYTRPSLGSLKGKPGADVEQAFCLYRVDEMTLGMHTAKNRGGKTGFDVLMDVDYSTGKVGTL